MERERAFVPEFASVEVPVPIQPVPAGTALLDIATRTERFPEHQLPAGTVRDIGLYRDRITLVALPGGLPIVDSNLGIADDLTNPLAGKIPRGMRAIAVRVDETAAIEGWVRSGSIVDVLLVEKNRTTVIAEKVKVLSTERNTSPIENPSKGAVPATVTLLVSQEQCLAINTSIPMGKIAFALRSNRDADEWNNTRFSAEDLSPDHKSLPRARVSGVVKFGSGNDTKQLALVDGSWVPANDVPLEELQHNVTAPVEKGVKSSSRGAP